MTRQPASPAAAANIPPQLFAALGAPLAWTLHLVASWALVPAACELSGGVLLLHGITVVAIVVALLAGVVSWSLWKRFEDGSDVPIAVERSRWMALAGLALTPLFLLAIVFAGAANFIVGPCNMGA